MSARVVSIREYPSQPGEYMLLVAELSGRGPETIGVLLLDAAADTLHVRLRRDWEQWASEEDAEVLAALEDQFLLQSREEGGKAVLDRLERDASNSLRATDREPVTVANFEKSLNDLYRRHVPSEILRFRTHLPRYSLAVAAGPFLTNSEDIAAEEWVEVPADLKLNEDMFVARIQGHSMEPRIPDGSYCIFHKNVVGSRNGRLVLVRNSELADDNQYTVKRYVSTKKHTGDDRLLHTRIRLESLNPAYPSWDLEQDEDKYEVIAEFVRVLD